jgi:hypothetical protein
VHLTTPWQGAASWLGGDAGWEGGVAKLYVCTFERERARDFLSERDRAAMMPNANAMDGACDGDAAMARDLALTLGRNVPRAW